MTHNLTPFLTFQNQDAGAAIDLYLSLFEDSRIVSMTRYGAEGPGPEGTVMHAVVSLNGQQIRFSDSPVEHEWDFSPGISLFVECKSEDELTRLFNGLSEGGKIYMPLDDYGFSKKFGWVGDCFGVTWQLNLA